MGAAVAGGLLLSAATIGLICASTDNYYDFCKYWFPIEQKCKGPEEKKQCTVFCIDKKQNQVIKQTFENLTRAECNNKTAEIQSKFPQLLCQGVFRK